MNTPCCECKFERVGYLFQLIFELSSQIGLLAKVAVVFDLWSLTIEEGVKMTICFVRKEIRST